jgi:hypothetical protein
MVSKKHIRIAPNTGCAESKTALDTSTDVIGLRKSAFQANIDRSNLRCCIKITLQLFGSKTNRGLLKNLRAMDLEVSDIGTKALPEATSVKLRDVINGYAQVKARYPELNLSRYVFTENEDSVKMS